MDSPEMCGVDGCGRRAAASAVRSDLPGPIRLCATHMEDFRMNGDRWTITWDPVTGEPASMVAAPAAAVGRGPTVAGSTLPAGSSPRKLAGRMRSVWHRPTR